MTVTVHHIGEACVQCNMTKRQLEQLQIPYEEIDLREHPELVEKFKEQGHLTAPIVTVGESQIWSGFKLERIRALKLQREGK